MKTENSCYNCPNRKEACHDNCEVYKAWKAEYQRKEKEETKTRKAYYNYVYYRSKDGCTRCFAEEYVAISAS